MVKYLFSDVDGTLLQNGKIDLDVVNKIKEFINKGNKFVLVTGRLDHEIKEIEDSINIYGDYRISQSGVATFNKNGKLEDSYLINPSCFPKLFEFIENLDNVDSIEVNTIEKRFGKKVRKSNYDLQFLDSIKENQDIFNNPDKYPISNLIVLSEDLGNYNKIDAYLSLNHPELQVTITSPGFVEIFRKDASKGNAIAKLANKHNINYNDIFVVGDNYNDISMFNQFSNSFVIKGSNIEVSACANYQVSNVGEVIEFIFSKIN